MARNIRTKNGSKHRRQRRAVASRGNICAICGQPIDMTLKWWVNPVTGKRQLHPLSFTVDHIKPLARWREFGYPSIEAARDDPNNWQAAHRICNMKKSDKTMKDKNLPNIRFDAFAQPIEL